MMQNKSPINLVITCALNQELPVEWIRSLGYPILSLKALQSGGLNALSKSPSILFITTGVGKKNSVDTALFIKNNIQPLYVINIGTCGNTTHKFPLGELVIPEKIFTKGSPELHLDGRFPFPLFSLKKIIPRGILYSSLNRTHTTSCDFIDMEAYFQASVFHNSPIFFHCIKSVSDYADSHTEITFQKGLVLCRENIKHLLSWLIKSHQPPEICVIVPTYNREKTITRCIDSILKQSYPAKEIIVVDDGSTDNTLHILEKYKGLIKVVKNINNKGVSYSRNIGTQHSISPWIAYLDSDDEWLPNKLLDQARYLSRHPHYDILQSEEIWIRNGSRLNKKSYHKKQEGFIFEISLERCMITPSSVLISRDLFNKYIGFDDSLPSCEDYDLWLRICRHHPVGLDTSESVIKYGGHADQLSEKYSAMDQFRVKTMLKILEKEKDTIFQNIIKKNLDKKLGILIQGFKKRNNLEKIQYYQNIRSRIFS
jgi:glycosyltransferase involved in cell wall biosynthesis